MRTRSLAVLSALVAVSPLTTALAPAPARAQNVLISELCDPHLNYLTDRFLEIANVGSTPVDLTGWSLVAVGNTLDIFTWTLSGTIAPGEALVAGDATTVVSFPVDFADEAWSTSNSTWNGKVGDGARLLGPGAVLVDIVVATGTLFENSDLWRNPDVLAPNTTYTPAEWSVFSAELATDGTPGTHTIAGVPQGPIVTNPLTDPALPVAADSVHVFADVADTVGTITSVDLFWGTSPDSITNVVAMSLQSGTTYRTDIPVPTQAQGTTVHYEIHAANDVPASTELGFLSYAVPYELDVTSIQGMTSASPYDGEVVLTGGIATAAFGTSFVIQDGAGGWTGIWARSSASVTVGDSLVVRGRVTESDPFGFAGNTLIDSALVVSVTPGGGFPAAAVIATPGLADEQYEGVLARIDGAQCTDDNTGLGEWEITDGGGTGIVGDLADAIDPVLGTVYDVTGCVTVTSGTPKLEPTGPADVVFVSDSFAPLLTSASALNDTTVITTFSEAVEASTSELPANYSVTGLTVLAATHLSATPDKVRLTVTTMTTALYTLTVDDVEDPYGNAVVNEQADFNYAPPPPGYYDTAEGLDGEPLRAALHLVIDNHTVVTYSDTWVSFYTTDDKPNGKVWDMYSDVPGGTPPYEYTFGVDQGGVGGSEGTGYNREHSWPQSWFNGLSPMDSDLFQLCPTDNYVNNQRGSWPYGEVDSPSWTSLNGSRIGPCSFPGYSGTAFEPIDEYKGDFARSYFYMTTRYYTEDGSWSTSDMTDRADLLPWAVDLLLQWHAQDPVSEKEIDRNGAIYAIQGNRNPFIDRPEFAERMLSTAVGVLPPVASVAARDFALLQNAPNPFDAHTVIVFSAPSATDAHLSVYDVSGRLVTELLNGAVEPGRHELRWSGRNANGRPVAPGVYFYRVEAGPYRETRRMVRLR